MPLTDTERRFLDHYLIESYHFERSRHFCVAQLKAAGIDNSELLPLLAVREREWNADYQNPFPEPEKFLDAEMPQNPTPCPWSDSGTFHQRLRQVGLLCEENAILSRDFSRSDWCGQEFYINEPPNFENSATITNWAEFLPTQGWKYRATFQAGIRRGKVSESLCQIPFSIWDPLKQPPIAVHCHYLMLIETPPEPIRIWNVTRSDVLTYAGNGDKYLTIFPTPFIP